MDLALNLHAALARPVVMYFALVGLWGLGLGIRGSGPTGSFNSALVIAEVVVIVQGLLGGIANASRAFDGIHALYGVALLVALPLAVTLVRDRQPRGQSIALGIAMLFAAGLAIRGITTAG